MSCVSTPAKPERPGQWALDVTEGADRGGQERRLVAAGGGTGLLAAGGASGEGRVVDQPVVSGNSEMQFLKTSEGGFVFP